MYQHFLVELNAYHICDIHFFVLKYYIFVLQVISKRRNDREMYYERRNGLNAKGIMQSDDFLRLDWIQNFSIFDDV